MADRRAEGWGDQAARSVLLVEDDALLRDLMARELERHGFRIETAANAIEAKRAFDARDHDALILDINLGPGATGFDLAEIIRAESPYAAIVFLTDVPDPRFIGRELGDVPLGVAYVRKSGLQNLDAVVAALDRVLRGEGFWAARDDRDPNRPFATLTRGQVFVARLIAQGLSNAQIAEVRGVTVKSVEETITRTAVSLGLDARTEGSVRVAIARRYLAAVNGDTSVAGAGHGHQP